MAEATSIKCHICGSVSYSANDVRHHYCGKCKTFLQDWEFELDPLREKDAIEKAHDVLTAIVSGSAPNPFLPSHRPALQAYRDVLCWVLRHDNSTFADNLLSIYAALEEVDKDQERTH